ncbi:MAG: stage II sporulation protein R [Firmicutes bacterium]|nr:stage II sporulation protein R [Bacillota bacterium]
MKVIVGGLFVVGAVAILAIGGLFGMGATGNTKSEFLRLHIRANSNSADDQAVKYLIRNAIIDDLTPMFSLVTTREQAMHTLGDNIPRIKRISNEVLAREGFDYQARAALRSEYFPIRNYGNLTLPNGIYDALIIELGAGEGNNWWSVVYPPLCFLDNNIGGERGVIYRSRLQEIISRFF